MPYRRLPKTDSARLKALKTLLDNNDIYTVRNRFIDWKTINRAQPIYDKLLTAVSQYKMNQAAQVRNSARVVAPQRKATMYVSHFLQVLFMTVERGELRKSNLKLYGLDENTTTLPNIKTAEGLLHWGKLATEGERQRLKKGGRPIYNPSIGMVSTHFDIFKNAYEQQQRFQQRTAQSLKELQKLRPEADEVLLDLWNQIEKHFENEPPETRFKECRKYGVIYYYRRHEPHDY